MRNLISKLVLVAVVVLGAGVFAVGPALADGHEGPLAATDGRYNPQVDDRLAIYLKDTGVEVWGIDSSLNGFYLTTFSAAELAAGKAVTHQTAQGTVSLHMDIAPVTQLAFTDDTATAQETVVTQAGQYTISWKGGSYGANGSADFSKTILADYNQ